MIEGATKPTKCLGGSELSTNKPYFDLVSKAIKNNQKIMMKDGRAVSVCTLPARDDVKQGKGYAAIFHTPEGAAYKWTDIVKKQFTSRHDPLLKENQALSELSEQIQTHIATTGFVDIRGGGTVYRCVGVVSTPGTVKSDFHLVDENGEEVFWISHKDGTLPTHFGQWGGVSAAEGAHISEHREVEQFIDSVKMLVGAEMPRAISYGRAIKDEWLSQCAVFGNRYGHEYGRQNVQVAIQGPVRLVKHTNRDCEVVGHHVMHNGVPITGSYKPVLSARYQSDRVNGGIRHCRMSMYPAGGRKFTWI